MKTKLLAIGIVILDILIIIYIVLMNYGWQGVLRLLGAFGFIVGALFMIFVTLWALGELMGEDDGGEL